MASQATAVSDIERAEHLNYAAGAGVKRVSIYNDGAQVNAATEETLLDVKAAVQGLGGSTAPIEVLAESFTLTQGGVVSGTYTDTHLAGGVYHLISEDATNGFDVFYQFDVPDGFTAGHAEFVGRYQGSGAHEVNVYAYNWSTTVWDKVSSPANHLTHSTSDYSKSFDLIADHTSQLGKVQIRILHETATYNAGHRLYVDHIDVYFTASGATRIINKGNELINPATEEKQDDTIDAITNKDILIALKSLILAIANPSYVDKSANAIRNQVQSGTITTVSTVTAVTGLTNIDGYQGKLQIINQNNGAWAQVVRARIT